MVGMPEIRTIDPIDTGHRKGVADALRAIADRIERGETGGVVVQENFTSPYGVDRYGACQDAVLIGSAILITNLEFLPQHFARLCESLRLKR